MSLRPHQSQHAYKSHDVQIQTNCVLWDSWTRLHVESAHYDVAPETHDSTGKLRDRRYFCQSEPVLATYSGTYAVPEAGVWQTAYFWDHPLGEIVTAVCDAGLRLAFLHEHPKPAGAPFHADYPDGAPYLFSLRASAPDALRASKATARSRRSSIRP